MFEKLENALVLLFQGKNLNNVGSYLPNGKLYYIKRDTKNGYLTVNFSFSPEIEFNQLLASVETCIKSCNFQYEKNNYMSGFANAVTIKIYK